MKKILFISGSLRKESYNTQLMAMAADILSKDFSCSFLDYRDIPFMNQDIEYPAPDSIQHVRKDVLDADGIWIFSPEYNYSIPGVLKNLLDWLSRPLVKGDPERRTAMTGKAVTLSGAGGRSGASNARKRLSELLLFMKARQMEGEETSVALTPEEFSSDTVAFSDELLAKLGDQAERFLKFIAE